MQLYILETTVDSTTNTTTALYSICRLHDAECDLSATAQFLVYNYLLWRMDTLWSEKTAVSCGQVTCQLVWIKSDRDKLEALWPLLFLLTWAGHKILNTHEWRWCHSVLCCSIFQTASDDHEMTLAVDPRLGWGLLARPINGVDRMFSKMSQHNSVDWQDSYTTSQGRLCPPPPNNGRVLI